MALEFGAPHLITRRLLLSAMAIGGMRFAAAAALLLGSVAALGTNYEHDGKTTYCWAIPQPTNRTTLSEALRTQEFVGDANCPLSLSLTVSNTTVAESTAMQLEWTVKALFAGENAIDHTRIFLGRDNKGGLAQIVHSNVHSCVFGTGCDPFNDGQQLVDKTVNKVANFTDGTATFTDTIQFGTPGEYSVLAHIILPSDNVSERFDYAVYTKVTVVKAADAPPPSATTAAPAQTTATPAVETQTPVANSEGGISQEATVGIIVGVIVVVVAVAVVAVVLRRRRQSSGPEYRPAPRSDTLPAPKMHQSAVTMTNSTTGFESAWGGERPTMLDQSNSSSAAGYAAPTTSLDRSNDSGSAFSKAMRVQDLTNSNSAFSGTGGRKKRVDSDVEL